MKQDMNQAVVHRVMAGRRFGSSAVGTELLVLTASLALLASLGAKSASSPARCFHTAGIESLSATIKTPRSTFEPSRRHLVGAGKIHPSDDIEKPERFRSSVSTERKRHASQEIQRLAVADARLYRAKACSTRRREEMIFGSAELSSVKVSWLSSG